MATSHYRTGLQIGHERGEMDRRDGIRVPLDELWVPDGAVPEYRQGLLDVYRAGIAGEPNPADTTGAA